MLSACKSHKWNHKKTKRVYHKVMADSKVSIRFGVRGSGIFPNAGIIVLKVAPVVANFMVENVGKLRDEVRKLGADGMMLADKIICEYRNSI